MKLIILNAHQSVSQSSINSHIQFNKCAFGIRPQSRLLE